MTITADEYAAMKAREEILVRERDAANARAMDNALRCDALAKTIDAQHREIEWLRGWLSESLDELDALYMADYAGDHPHSQRQLARARSAWADARAALQGKKP